MDTLTSNTNFIVAAPRRATDKALAQKLSGYLADLDEVREAHLPAVIEFGATTEARLTLIVVVAQVADKDAIQQLLSKRMSGRFSATSKIDLKVVPDDFPLLQAVRDTGCVIGWRD